MTSHMPHSVGLNTWKSYLSHNTHKNPYMGNGTTDKHSVSVVKVKVNNFYKLFTVKQALIFGSATKITPFLKPQKWKMLMRKRGWNFPFKGNSGLLLLGPIQESIQDSGKSGYLHKTKAEIKLLSRSERRRTAGVQSV